MSAPRIVHLESTSSTMVDAAALAAAGEPHGTAVVAERQGAGIGRHGHTWHSNDSGGLYLSVVLRLDLPTEQMPVLTMALGLAVQAVTNEFAQVSTDLRWPNDVLLNEKKLAGILVQIAGGACIAGIGLNINQKFFPEELQSVATSLALETGQPYDKADLLQFLLPVILRYVNIFVTRGKHEIFRLLTAHSSYVNGRHVEVDMGDRSIQGITAGLDENGFLMVTTAQGTEKVIAGGVRPLTA